jgi:biopolymer transport protein TolR
MSNAGGSSFGLAQLGGGRHLKHQKTIGIKTVTTQIGDINVTPFVDIVLVLLIIFMVLTPLLDKEIGIQVPATEKVQNPSDVPPDQLIVKLEASGELSINTEKVNPEKYVPELTKVLEKRADKTVFVIADDKARYSWLIQVLDGAKQAGAKTLGMSTEPPESP